MVVGALVADRFGSVPGVKRAKQKNLDATVADVSEN